MREELALLRVGYRLVLAVAMAQVQDGSGAKLPGPPLPILSPRPGRPPEPQGTGTAAQNLSDQGPHHATSVNWGTLTGRPVR